MADGSLFVTLSRVLPEFVLPLFLACTLLAASLVAWGRPRLRVGFVAMALCLLLVASCGPASAALGRSLEWRYLPLAVMPRVDAIVVLGGATRPVIPPRVAVEVDASGSRLFEAARLYHAGIAPLVLVAGGGFGPAAESTSEAPEMAQVLRQLGVSDSAMVLEEASRNTFENAVEARKVLAPRGALRIALVTSALHMPRAVGLFRHQGFDVVPAPTDFNIIETPEAHERSVFVWLQRLIPSASSLAYTTRALREYLGIAVYRALGRISPGG